MEVLQNVDKTIQNTSVDGLGLGMNVVGKISKGVGSTMNYASTGLGYAKDLTIQSWDYATNGIKTGVDNVSNGFNSFGTTAETYGQRWTSGSRNSLK